MGVIHAAVPKTPSKKEVAKQLWQMMGLIICVRGTKFSVCAGF